MKKSCTLCVLVPLVISSAVMATGLYGEWSTTVGLLPDAGLEDTSLSLGYDLGTWSVGGTAELLGTDGYVWQSFDVRGGFGFAELGWEVLFGPRAPAFLYTWGTVGTQLVGLEITLYSALVGPDVPGQFFSGGPAGGAVLVLGWEVAGIAAGSTTGIGARLLDTDQDEYFSVVYTSAAYSWDFPVDPFPGGLRFTYQELSLSGVPVCCGITADVLLSFTKAGFDFLRLSAYDMFTVWEAVVYDLEIEYGVNYKSVFVTPRFAWFDVVACVEVYGDWAVDPWALDIYGVNVRCELGDCGYAEFVTAFDVLEMQELFPELKGEEFEYVKLGFCGPACCGAEYSVDLAVYFDDGGGLLGISRLGAAFSVPLIENLALTTSLEIPVIGDASFSFGWTFTF